MSMRATPSRSPGILFSWRCPLWCPYSDRLRCSTASQSLPRLSSRTAAIRVSVRRQPWTITDNRPVSRPISRYLSTYSDSVVYSRYGRASRKCDVSDLVIRRKVLETRSVASGYQWSIVVRACTTIGNCLWLSNIRAIYRCTRSRKKQQTIARSVIVEFIYGRWIQL